MFGRLTVYSKIYKLSSSGNRTYLKSSKGKYKLLEIVTEWYGDKNRGLAKYLDGDILDTYIDKIQYECENGMIKFEVIFKEGYDENDTITLSEFDYEIMGSKENCYTLKAAVCKYILGQISDGWGEDGVYILDLDSGKVFLSCCENELYVRDYEKYHQLAMENGEEFSSFDDYPAYKLVEYNRNCQKCKYDVNIDCPFWRNKYFSSCSHYEEK